MITTIMIRRLCAAAIVSTLPPLRSPWSAISEAAPTAPAKNAVAGSACAKRRSAQAQPSPTRIAHATPERIGQP